MDRKSIFITGAASGIGRETARLFHVKGWFVGGFDMNQTGLDTLKAEIGDANGLFQRLDVSDRAGYLAAIAAFSAATGGHMDILFNNAGIDVKGPFDQTPWEKVLAVLNVNIIGVMSGVHAAMPLLRATPNALCFTTASASAIFGMGEMAVYSASKHAVRGFTEALSTELQSYGVRAADVMPGIIDTGMLKDEDKARVPKDGMWRLITPMQIAETVWDAYHGDKIHYYVPAELKDFDRAATAAPEETRAAQLALRKSL